MKQGSYTHHADRSFDRLGDRGYIFQVETLFIHLTSRRGEWEGRQAGRPIFRVRYRRLGSLRPKLINSKPNLVVDTADTNC